MDDLALWLGAQLDEDERIALKSVEQAIVNLAGADAASVVDWHVVERPATGTFVATRDQWDRVAEIVPTYGGAHSEHIAEHDPARVLREIEMKRSLVRAYTDALTVGPDVSGGYRRPIREALARQARDFLLVMALPYSHRPGFAEAIASAG